MGPDTAISRLSFAQARASAIEAFVDIARHRAEMLDAAADGKLDAKADALAARARDEQRKVDKTA